MNCLDAETLAAWVDGGLKGAALEDVQAHVAGCERCQALLGAMGRTRAAVPAPEVSRSPRRWLAWGVPLTAAATALAIWVLIPEQRQVPVVAPAVAPVERAEPTEPIAPTEPAAPSEPTEPKAAPRRAPAAQTPPQAPPPPPPKQETASLEDRVLQRAAAAPTAPAPSATPESAPRVTTTAEAPPRPQTVQERDGFGINALEETTAPRKDPATAVIETLCGAAWRAAPSDVASQLTAGSAPSTNVCWVVGLGGLVRRSTNGRTWVRITFPEMTDLSAITAADSRNATVTTGDGRTFRTADGGRTWVRR